MSYKQNQSYHNKQSEFFSVLCLVGLEDSVNFQDKSQGKVEESKAILDYFWNAIKNCSMAIVSKYMDIKWLVL